MMLRHHFLCLYFCHCSEPQSDPVFAILFIYSKYAVRMSQFSFAEALLAWFDVHGRHDLPWQVIDDPYQVWVSEIMLQQTQVKTVLQYFERFISRFPTVEALGQASWDDVAPIGLDWAITHEHAIYIKLRASSANKDISPAHWNNGLSFPELAHQQVVH